MIWIETEFAVITGSVVLALAFVVLYFQVVKIQDSKKARSRLIRFEHSIQFNQSQIIKRKNHLDRYNFLAYNLDEALIIQPEIVV
ncbi:hypothetical protein ACFSYG_07550 [Leeuwenhoekiella polynyae]|uniref:Uncharacterized protein n=1 Tax=Leeuwenhoekiella polynyae TaxID=1550906 RepID=A0A4Q0P0X0_9FLAO|nr:hypothetical protein [Leeuwenhoekiella polynyae]RXG20027.1 hypothetical protein DSM02_2872 [Leeuwenhoekiella polynyae]|tara:strand:- start:161 stop:415 length:255 start_codon:yes stop_codon:yes gene_type:complete